MIRDPSSEVVACLERRVGVARFDPAQGGVPATLRFQVTLVREPR